MPPAKQPLTGLAGPYGHPLHPALVALPIGAWLASFVFDIASRVVDEPAAAAQGARWLIAIGVLGALLAACVGALDLFAIPTGTRAHRVALVHAGLNLAVTAAYAANFALRGAHPTGPVGVGPVGLSAASLLALAASGYLGGALAFRYGVRVADEQTQAEGFEPVRQDRSA
jgi:uncharacterized membrane protein